MHAPPAPFVPAERVGELVLFIKLVYAGNPNHGGLPAWPAFDAEKRSTMVFDDTCAVKDDPDGDELAALAASMRWT